MPNVKIRVESVSADEMQAQKQGEEVKGKQDAGMSKVAVASLFAHQAINTGKQIMNYYVSNIGTRTGDYIKQEQVEQTLSVVSDIATIGLGFASGGIAGGVIASIGVATKAIFKEVSTQQEIKHAEISANYLRERSGNSTKNGSRTGD